MYSHDFFDYNGETRSLSYRYYRGSKNVRMFKRTVRLPFLPFFLRRPFIKSYSTDFSRDKRS